MQAIDFYCLVVESYTDHIESSYLVQSHWFDFHRNIWFSHQLKFRIIYHLVSDSLSTLPRSNTNNNNDYIYIGYFRLVKRDILIFGPLIDPTYHFLLIFTLNIIPCVFLVCLLIWFHPISVVSREIGQQLIISKVYMFRNNNYSLRASVS